MSNTPDEQRLKLPVDLPKCDCFSSDDPEFAMANCAGVGRACNTMVAAFYELAHMETLCKVALPYFAEMFVISIFNGIAKVNGPALEYGSVEIEWEVERMIEGMEARILARSRDIFARSRELGITEASLKAMDERDARGGNQS